MPLGPRLVRTASATPVDNELHDTHDEKQKVQTFGSRDVASTSLGLPLLILEKGTLFLALTRVCHNTPTRTCTPVQLRYAYSRRSADGIAERPHGVRMRKTFHMMKRCGTSCHYNYLELKS